MKLRIKGDSIRLRLTQGEVSIFRDSGKVKDTLNFGGGGFLDYVLESCPDCSLPEADFSENTLTVRVPEHQAMKWTDTDLVGFNNESPANRGSIPFILIEKDFQCLHDRPREDESDNFPNPMAKG